MPGLPIESLRVQSYTVPTETPESDGTLAWQATTLVVVHLRAAGQEGLGYGYADRATALLIADRLAPLLEQRDAWAIPARRCDMARAVRNLGQDGIAAMAISIVDVALWDRKAKQVGQPLGTLLGMARQAIPVYGSGGFTSAPIDALCAQLGQWSDQGMRSVKMKVGREPEQDVARVAAVRKRIGQQTDLFVDANGAYRCKQALAFAERFEAYGVRWFEEPVSSDDLEGLRLVRERGPAGMAISAGEYGYRLPYFRRMLDARAVDTLQADATRCGGVTGFMACAALCEAYGVPLPSHCAPALHTPLCCAAQPALHLEYFHDHVRIERLLFDGAPIPADGLLAPAAGRPGLGLVFKDKDAQCYKD